MERNREIAAELLKQGKKVWQRISFQPSFPTFSYSGPACLHERRPCPATFVTEADEQDKALLALKRRKMQGKLIEKTDDQVMIRY